MMRVRPATAQDIPQMARLWAGMAAECGGATNPDVEAWSDEMRDGMATGKGHVIVAVEGDTVVGFCDIVLAYEPGQREVIASGRHGVVDKAHRNSGIGRMMVVALCKVAKKQGAAVFVTHGTMTRHVVADIFGRPMVERATLREIRL